MVNLIRDSLLEAKKTSENLYLFSLPIDKFAEEYYKGYLFKPSENKLIDFIKTIAQNSYKENLPEEFREKANDINYDPSLFFKEDELPQELVKKEYLPLKHYYFLIQDNSGLGIQIEKLDKLYSPSEATDLFFSKGEQVTSVPLSIIFPFRKFIIYLVGLLGIILFSPFYLYIYNTLKEAKQEENFQRKYAIMWLLIMIVSLVSAISVFLFKIEISKGGGAIFMISLVLMITAFIVSIMYLKRTKLLSKMLKGENIIVKWIYPNDIWQSYIESEYSERKKVNAKAFMMLAFILIIIFSIFMIIDKKMFPLMLYVLLGFLLLLFIISKMTPLSQFRKQIKAKPIAIISSNGVLIGKALHSWNVFNTRFERAEYIKEEYLHIEITYSYWARYHRENVTVRIPILKGEESKIEYIINKLNTSNK